MRRSKLETYIDILQILAEGRQLRETHVMRKANVNCNALKDHSSFLKKQGLIEEKNVGKTGIVYSITPRGLAVLKGFKELRTVLPTLRVSVNRPRSR
jgi:predicted transcriptional regulator